MSKADTTPAHSTGVGLLAKALHILDLFQIETPTWSQADLVRETGMTKSTVNRLVRYLTERGYLALLDGRGRYTLGPAAIDLGRRATALFDFREICQPVLEQLSQATNETVLLTSVVASGNAVRCVDQIESTREGLRVFEQIGAIFPLHAGAAPKAVLAFLDDAARTRYLTRPMAAMTENTIIDPVRLMNEIEDTRARGYSISREETYTGVAGVGAPFFWPDGRPAGSLAVAAPIHRATDEAIEIFGRALLAAARRIDSLLAGQSAGEMQKAAS